MTNPGPRSTFLLVLAAMSTGACSSPQGGSEFSGPPDATEAAADTGPPPQFTDASPPPHDATTPDAGGGPEAGAVDAPAGLDAPAGNDAAEAGPAPPVGGVTFGDGGACAHELANPNCWTGFGTAGVHPGGAFLGGGFDGRYVYLASSGDSSSNEATRYDTTVDFTSPSSWTAFNLSAVNGSTPHFAGTGFDGRFVYFVPCDPGFGSVLSRYDTQGAFGASASWSNFDMSQVNGVNPSTDGQCDVGAVFDGRYVYFVPNSIYEYWKGTVARYDTQAPFGALASWSTFDTLTLSQYSAGFQGAAFDGRYIYFVPWGDVSTGTPIAIQSTPLITRYDTTASFDSSASWTTFDPSGVGPTNSFVGAAFDGRYVYFAPGDYRGQATRYDTQGSFTAATSWAAFPMTSLGPGAQSPFLGARFDGRYVYFIPSGSVLVRFDTTGTFSSAASWSRLDLTVLDARAGNYWGGVFDGRYLYVVPESSNLVLRFDAEPAGAIPAHSGASFF